MTDGSSLRSTAWVLSGISIATLSLADYVSHGGKRGDNLTDEDSLELGLFILGACALMWAAPLAQLAGARLRRKDGFKLVQFFAGGLPSVLIQAFAWSCYATAVFASIMSLLNPAVHLRGLKTGLGLLGLAAQALVNASIDLFEGLEANEAGSSGVATAVSGKSPSNKKKRSGTKIVLSALSLILSVTSLVACILLDFGYFAQSLKSSVWNFSMAHITLTIFGVAYFRDRSKEGTEADEVIHVAEIFSFLLYGCAVWIYLRLHTTPVYASLRGTTLGFGIIDVVSCTLSVYTFMWQPSQEDVTSSPKIQMFPPRGVARLSWIYRFSVALLVGAIVVRFQSTSLSAILSLVGSPLAHLGTWLVFRDEDGFHFARALQGGAVFSIFQGVGWMTYAIALLGVIVYGISTDVDLEAWGSPTWDDAGEFLQPIAFVSHAALLWSKQVFMRVSRPASRSRSSLQIPVLDLNDPAPATVPEQKDVPVAHRQQPPPLHPSHSWISTIAYSLTGLSIVTHFLFEDNPELSIGISVATACIVTIRMPRPFTGTAPVVVQQALGWTLFIASIAGQGVLIFNLKRWFEYAFLAVLVRAFGLIVLITAESQLSKSARKTQQDRPSPRKRKKTEEEMSLDIREIDSLIAVARRPAVLTALEEARKNILVGARKRRLAAVVLGVVCVVIIHVALVLSAFVDMKRTLSLTNKWALLLLIAEGTLWSSCALVIQGWLGPMLWGADGYRWYQPFRGGLHHVVLQAIGWTLIVFTAIARLVCFNYGIAKIELDGLITGIGFASYCGEIVLMASLARFDSDAPHLGFAFDLDGRGLGWILSVGALILFLGVDIAIVRFGLQDTSLIAPVIVCAWVAVALSVPLAYMLEQREDPTPRSRFGIMRVAALAVWTFSLFLTFFLIGRAATLSSSTWLPSKTGFASVIAHGMMTVSSDPAKAAFVTQQLVFILASAGFLLVVMPLVRGLLDGPMWYYAYYFKSWRHSLSPDGKHPMERAFILRNVKYGSDVMDVMVPVDNETEEAEASGGTKSNGAVQTDDEAHPPVVYLHGGGHLFVKRELLAHSVTPLCRAGMVVYSVEYPLSPESRFPKAIVCILQALVWIRKNHCRGGCCVAGGPPKICEECKTEASSPASFSTTTSTTVGSNSPPAPPLSDFPCRCCPHKRGSNVVQMLGDSAGGNLAAMVTAVLTNPHLLEKLSPFSGHVDFMEWVLPKVQRLGVIYGLLGRKVTEDGDESSEQEPTWTEWLVRRSGESVLNFVLHQYSGGVNNLAMEGKMVLNDFEGTIKDFAPETLLLCGTADPLLATNRQALKLIRQQTGRECNLVEYEGSIHSFHGMPVQWTFGRWLKDAYPATCELVKFFSGGKHAVADVDFKSLPRDYSPLIVFPVTFFGTGVMLRMIWYAAWASVDLALQFF